MASSAGDPAQPAIFAAKQVGRCSFNEHSFSGDRPYPS